MLRLLQATGTLLSVFALIGLGSKTTSTTTSDRVVRWSVAVKAHNQFSNWT